MKSIRSMIAALALAFVLPAAADAATTDPEVIIYRFPGVVDDGDSNAGIATIFNCTNFSGTTETVRFATRSTSGTLIGNVTVSIQHLATKTASTHNTLAFTDDTLVLQIAMLGQGTTAIAATSINIICTAMIVDAANAKPVGVALRGIRFNPIPGTQE
jgi:dihydrodipicolinate synthase/N-acetylneuraminate lyase